MILVSRLFSEAGVVPDALFGDAEISRLTADSRTVRPGDLFVCMPSANSDSHAYIPEAAEKGAAAVLVHSRSGVERLNSLPGALLEASRFQDELWKLAKVGAGDPSAKMRVTGITGTNGKTTTAWILAEALRSLGRKTTYLGTLGLQTSAGLRELPNTTPYPIELNALLGEALADGAQDLVMEVSSHALEQKRVDGVEFNAGVFTNLTQDHLDFHGTMQAYEASKRRFFFSLPEQAAKSFTAVLNVADPVGAKWHAELTGARIGFGLNEGELRAQICKVLPDRLGLRAAYGGHIAKIEAPVGGSFNVWNVLAATGALLALGYSLEDAAAALRQVKPAPGRFEPVPNDAGIHILVDYAHTPDALDKLLHAAREIAHGRIITVFGCGGDRDRAKRSLMARAASSNSDLTVITSDNPRTEEPSSIILDIEPGLVPGAESISIEDRREAVAYAVGHAKPGDVVVIAGKGHENYQIIGRTKYPMDDRELAREALR